MKLDVITTLMFGAMAGVCAEVITYPLEVIRRKMQLERTLASRRIRIGAAPIGTAAAAQRLVRSSLPTSACLAASECFIPVASSSHPRHSSNVASVSAFSGTSFVMRRFLVQQGCKNGSTVISTPALASCCLHRHQEHVQLRLYEPTCRGGCTSHNASYLWCE